MDVVLEWLRAPWPWYISGALIGLMIPIMMLGANRRFGLSSSYRQICAASVPLNLSYFKNYDWKGQAWRLWFVLGILIGGFIAGHYLEGILTPDIEDSARQVFSSWGLNEVQGLLPEELYSWDGIMTLRGFLVVVLGGFLMGFGTRYADGCTSGHAIMGISMLNPASFVATISFFIGGVLMTHLILPYLLKL